MLTHTLRQFFRKAISSGLSRHPGRNSSAGGKRTRPATCLPGSVESLELRMLLTTFDVGYGLQYTSVGAVPWNNLTAGDTVYIHWRSPAQGGDYHEKINIPGQGTAAKPIEIIGVPGPNGEKPVINGANATTGAVDTTLYLGHQARGLITFTRSNINQDFDFYKPEYIVLDGLVVTGANPTHTFTNSAGTVTTFSQNAAAVYIERGSDITIRNCEISDSGNGFFAGSNDYSQNGGDGGMIRNVLFEHNDVHDNGTPNGASEHNIYTEGVNFTFQYNLLGPLRPTSLGANLKDRSAGTVIRYNDIYGGGHLLDLVHAQESASITTQLPSYRETYVYGNILHDAPGITGSMVHYGGDDLGNTQDFRKGTLYFYNNTVIVQANQSGTNGVYQTVVFQLATNDESADIRDNIFYHSAAPGAPAGTTPSILAFASNGENGGQYHMGTNWVSPDWHAWYNDSPPAGSSFTGSENFITNSANDPGFVNVSTLDLHLTGSSQSIDAAVPLAPTAQASYPVTQQYVAPHDVAARPVTGPAPDLGAFEGPLATPVPPKVQFSSPTYSFTEQNGSLSILVTRTGSLTFAATVQFATSNGTATAPADYTAASGTLTFAAGQSSASFSVAVKDDTLVEGNETVNLTLSNPTGGLTLGSQSTATLTIVDNDSSSGGGGGGDGGGGGGGGYVPPTGIYLEYATYNTAENYGWANVIVTRADTKGAASVHFATANGTATAGLDYAATSGTLNFADGDLYATFPVYITDDSLHEPTETILVSISNPVGAALGTQTSAVIQIADNDPENTPPKATVTGPATGVRGQSRTFVLSATDSSSADQAAGFTFAIDWNSDGVVDQTVTGASGTQVTHTFPDTGTQKVTMTAADQNNAVSSKATASIAISAAGLQGTQLFVGGTLSSDIIAIMPTTTAGEVDVRINGVSVGHFQSATKLIVYGQDGDDSISIDPRLPVPTELNGGNGNDLLTGGGGNDSLLGGPGNDTYAFVTTSPLGSDTINDASGIDTLNFSGSTAGLTLNLSLTTTQTVSPNLKFKLASGAAIENVTGGSGNDILIGNGLDNVLNGGTGNDVLVGLGGHDTLMAGGTGRNILIGGDGADHLIGAAGDDLLIGGNYVNQTNVASIIAIRNEWTSSSDYNTRVGHLTTTNGGLNGSTRLSASTVTDDGAADVLTGNGGLDWFWGNAAEVSALLAGERRN